MGTPSTVSSGIAAQAGRCADGPPYGSSTLPTKQVGAEPRNGAGSACRLRGMGKSSDDNRANQLNPNNDAYWQSRGEGERPDDWEDDSPQKGSKDRPPSKK